MRDSRLYPGQEPDSMASTVSTRLSELKNGILKSIQLCDNTYAFNNTLQIHI